MPNELDFQHGLKGILLSIVGLISAMLASHIVKGIWTFQQRNKKPSREEFRQLTYALNSHREALGDQKNITSKISKDLRRVYLFLKVIAGDKWPTYRKKVEDIERDDQFN